MMRFAFIILLFLAATVSAHAAPLRGGGIPAPSCGPYVNGVTISDTIFPPPCPANSITDSSGNVWQFTGALSGDGVNWSTTCCEGAGQEVQLNVGTPFSPPGISYKAQVGYLETVDLGSGLKVWFCLCSFENSIQAISPGNISTGHFTDVTSGKAYNSLGEVINASTSGDTIHITAPPVGIAYWAFLTSSGTNQGSILRPLTINLDSGANFCSNGETENGRGLIVFDAAATNTTWNGGTVGCSADTAIAVNNSALNPTIENVTIHNEGNTCVLMGGPVGTVTLLNVTIYNCNTNTTNCVGTCHNLYISGLGGTGVTDTSCETITNLQSFNVQQDGWGAKLRPNCNGSALGTGVLTQSSIGCTPSSTPTSCRQNGVFDYPCGGQHSNTHNVFSLEGIVIGDGGGWYFSKYGEEIEQLGNPAAFCPQTSLATATNTVTFDHDIFIYDGPNVTANNSVTCLLTQSGGSNACGTPTSLPGSAFVCHLTNSIFVSNPNMPGLTKGGCNDSGAGCTLVPNNSTGKCTDSNNNRWYGSRTVAATNESWSGTWTDPTNGTVYNCCAWPWLPAHL